MAKKPLWHAAERIDLQDLLYGAASYPATLLRDYVRAVIGVGVTEGFRVRVLPQSGSQIGQLEILNGRGFDWGGQWINAETGIKSQRVVLGTPSTEYWLEIELRLVNSDPDQRMFWDSLVDNADPIPDGQEIPIAQTLTRQTVFWRVKYPIRSNTPNLRTVSAYTPSRFSDNETLVIPLACIRTNGSGQIIAGNPDTDITGNDLVSVTTAAGTEQYVKLFGYGESTHLSGGSNIVIGRKFTDRRPRLFEPILPPFEYGDTNEVLGDARSDWWMRDMKSFVDHVCHQIGQLKYGANDGTSGEADYGQTQYGDLLALDSRVRYADLSGIDANPIGSGTLTAYADQFVGCTFQIVSGHWSGFYALIEGNDETDLSGNTRIYLGRHSGYPDWKQQPGGSTRVRIVQHRQKNWLVKPGNAATNNRGVIDLDAEVAEGRADSHASLAFSRLVARLDGNKGPALTVKPYDQSRPAADVPVSTVAATAVSEVVTAMGAVVGTRGGGEVLFRGGTHTFDAYLPAQSLFQYNGATGLTFRGEGKLRTILSYGVSDQISAASGVHQVFDLSNCTDVTFQDMTIQGVGTILKLSSCINVRFINCRFISVFYTAGSGVTLAGMDLGGADTFTFENCDFEMAGAGIQLTQFTDSRMYNCRVVHDTLSTSNNSALLTLGAFRRSSIVNNRFQGVATTTILQADLIERSDFVSNEVLGGVTAVAGAVFLVGGASTKFNMALNKFDGAGSVGASGVPGVFLTVGLTDSKIIGNTIKGGVIGLGLNTATLGSVGRNHITDNKIAGPGASVANSIGIFANVPSDTLFVGNRIEGYETGISGNGAANVTINSNRVHEGTTGMNLQNMANSVIVGNDVDSVATRAYDLRNAANNQINGNRYTGVDPTTAIWDLTGGANNSGGNLRLSLFNAAPSVNLPSAFSVGGRGLLFLNDGIGGTGNDVFPFNQ